MGEQIREILKRVQDAIEVNGIVAPEDIKALEAAYDQATNASACPCGSGLIYENCCKREWITTKRMAHAVIRDRKQIKKSMAKADRGEGDQWIVRIGMDATGKLVVEPVGMGKEMPSIVISGILLGAYQDALKDGIVDTVNGACRNLHRRLLEGAGGIQTPKIVGN